MDAEALRRLADDPGAIEVELEAWARARRHPLLRTAEARQALQRAALFARELDGGRPLASIAQRAIPPAVYPHRGVRGGARFAHAHGLLTRDHAIHTVRLVRARARARRRGQDVQLPGLSFLARQVELTAPAGQGRVVVGPWSWLGQGVALRSHAGRVTIGAKVIIGGGSIVNSYLDVSIGEGALLADLVHITDFDHRTDRLDVPIRHQGIVTAPVRVGPDAWLGRGVTVLRGVDIGRGAVVGAGAVVATDIPPFAIAVGVPARPVRSRLPEGMDAEEATALLARGERIPGDPTGPG
jgi:acetyltransferase-like isoleucine patch superfamily enzyme